MIPRSIWRWMILDIKRKKKEKRIQLLGGMIGICVAVVSLFYFFQAEKAEYSSRVPAVYMFIGIKPEEKEAIPGLHSPEYQFDDTVLAGAAAAFANIAIHGCMGELKEN